MGKTIILFATFGDSGFGKTVAGLKGSVDADTVLKEWILLMADSPKKLCLCGLRV